MAFDGQLANVIFQFHSQYTPIVPNLLSQHLVLKVRTF
jgi:hypothetical protein